MLSMMIFMPSISVAGDYRDSILMNRIWANNMKIQRNKTDIHDNAYLIYTLDIKKRNVLLWLIPTMYSVSRYDKQYIGEEFGKITYRSQYNYQFDRQVAFSTIPRMRKPIPALFELQSPYFNGEQIYGDRLLSPFWRTNHRYYKYRIKYNSNGTAQVTFIPRVKNTQLVHGEALVNFKTGAIDSVKFTGEYDMLKFNVSTKMNPKSRYGLPDKSSTHATFHFLGNHIDADFASKYGRPQMPQNAANHGSSVALIKSLRPQPLTTFQDSIYIKHYENVKEREQKRQERKNRKRRQKMLAADSLGTAYLEVEDSTNVFNDNLNRVKDFLWDDVGGYMVNSSGFRSSNTSLSISPLLNPLYMSYSSSKGVSYKLRAAFSHHFNENYSLTLEPRLGYAFKIKQFYYTLPLVFHYSPKRRGAVGIIWANGNKTSSGKLTENFDSLVHKKLKAPEFRDEYVTLYNNIDILDWLSAAVGVNYHVRKATNHRELLYQLGLSGVYRSFAPFTTVKLMPWRSRGPILTANYERSIKNILRSNLQYERWEFDASYKYNVKSMQILNLRAGAGFYTHRSSSYFVDFNNFCDNNLPTGWDDDWSGQFQLIDSRWYNDSNYYIRGHVSYESPLLALSWLPWVGKFLETERLYLSALNIEHTRAYSELGYGFKCRYFSTAVFASFLNTNYHSIGVKFELELFRRW